MNLPALSHSMAIETSYQGYRFRSRLEARWAVFFDALRVPWEYEREGYELGATGRYLPDFWLSSLGMWAEVKPAAFSPDELAKCQALADLTDHEVLRLVGTPSYVVYWACVPGFPIDVGRDYILDDQYVHSERRWFACPGLADGEDASSSYWVSETTRAAYAAARGARFEYGEKPPTELLPDYHCTAGFNLHFRGRRIPPDLQQCAECGGIFYDNDPWFEGPK